MHRNVTAAATSSGVALGPIGTAPLVQRAAANALKLWLLST